MSKTTQKKPKLRSPAHRPTKKHRGGDRKRKREEKKLYSDNNIGSVLKHISDD